MLPAIAVDGIGPQATMTTGSSGIVLASSSATRMFGRPRTAFVTDRPNSSLSTARAFPAGTRTRSATRRRLHPRARSSAFSSPFPESVRSAPSELLQTSSANHPVRWAGEDTAGRISYRSTAVPEADRTSDASEPASPAPMTVTRETGDSAPGGRVVATGGLPTLGEENRENTAGSRSGPHFDESAVVVEDPLGDGQAQTCPFRLGGEKGIEDLSDDGGVDSLSLGVFRDEP